jgi:hypothetical protein
MSSASPERRPAADRNVSMPPTNKGLLAAAGVCLLIPIVALMWAGSHSPETAGGGGIAVFVGHQGLWVCVCTGLTYAAHLLVIAARGGRGGMAAHHDHHEAPPNEPVGDGDTVNPTPGFRSCAPQSRRPFR